MEKVTPETDKTEETKAEEKKPEEKSEERVKDKAGAGKDTEKTPEKTEEEKLEETDEEKDKTEEKKEPEGKPEETTDEAKAEKAMNELKSKYDALLIKDALTDAGAEYGLTRAQIPFVARMIDTAGLITDAGEVDTKALTSQLKGIMSAFPGLKATPKDDTKPGVQLGAPMGGNEGGESLRDKIMAAAGLK